MHERGGANLTADEDVPSPSARRAARSPRALLAFGLAALPAVAMWHLFRERTGIRLEDALITYRYAENLALGRGFVFNPGERVLGTTTPAYTVCLALLGYAFGTPLIPLISSVLCALFALAAGFLAFLTLAVSGVSRAVAALTALLLLGQPQVVVAATGGMETSLVLLCMTGSLWALRTGRTRAAVVACALLVLTRIDGVVWAGLVLLTVLAREPRRFAARFGLFALTLLPWLAFATWYFGSPVPHSVTAKRAVVYARDAALGPLENLHAHLTWFAQASGIRPEYQWLFVSPAPWLRAAIVVAFSLLFVAGARRVAVTSASRPLAIAVLFPFALGVVYWLGDAPRLFDWYLTPPLWCFTLVLGLGIEHGRRLVARLRSTGPRTVAGAALAGIV